MNLELTVGGAVPVPLTIDVFAVGENPPARVAAVLDRVRPLPEATHGTVVAADGYRASIPLKTLRAGGVFSVDDYGLRLHVEDGRTLCWNVKDVIALEVTVGIAPDDIPENPPH